MATQKKLVTMRKRTFKLNLIDDDCEDFIIKAASVGLTPEKLLENFINDLICGVCTNGSDEREYAERWFNRCDFRMFPDQTFGSYLFEMGDGIGWIDEILKCVERREDSRNAIEAAMREIADPDNNDWQEIFQYDYEKDCYVKSYESREAWEQVEQEYIEGEEEVIKESEGYINDAIQDYQKHCKKEITFEEAIQDAKKWKQIYENLLEETDEENADMRNEDE